MQGMGRDAASGYVNGDAPRPGWMADIVEDGWMDTEADAGCAPDAEMACLMGMLDDQLGGDVDGGYGQGWGMGRGRIDVSPRYDGRGCIPACVPEYRLSHRPSWQVVRWQPGIRMRILVVIGQDGCMRDAVDGH